MGAFASLSQAAVRRGQSSGPSFPVRRRFDSTLASLHIRRCVTSDFDISSVNTATGVSWRTARVAALQSPSAGLVQRRDPFEPFLQQLLDVAELARHALLRELEDDLLGPVDEFGALAGTVPAELRDLRPRADQAAQRRHVADDARVVAGVPARRHERRELVDSNLAADVVQLAALLQLVDERDRVDRLAFGVERERGAVDLRVALAVEVARVQELTDRPDRAGGEHHRAED